MAVKLFEISDDYEVKLNKEWILMIDEFAALLKRDKGSKGDYRGDKKLRATRELTFVYFYTDFNSPIRDYDDEERQREALIYAKMDASELDDLVWVAQKKYWDIQVKTARSLRTLKSMYKALDNYDLYLENLDFELKDKQGKLLNDPTAVVGQFTKIDKMYDAIRSFERRVEDEMKEVKGGIRGPKTTLGGQEGKKREWSESEIAQGSASQGGPRTSANFSMVLETIRAQAQLERKPTPREAVPSSMQDLFGEEDD